MTKRPLKSGLDSRFRGNDGIPAFTEKACRIR